MEHHQRRANADGLEIDHDAVGVDVALLLGVNGGGHLGGGEDGGEGKGEGQQGSLHAHHGKASAVAEGV